MGSEMCIRDSLSFPTHPNVLSRHFQIYVEVERARLTKQLADIREAEGNIAEAATVLQELQVETFGSMPKREKVEFILEQMRLCLARQDHIRTQIISKKISTKFFAEEKADDLKLKYYRLMIELDSHEDAYLNISKHYKNIFDTPSVSENKEESQKVSSISESVAMIVDTKRDSEC